MKERPILFSGSMIRAILADRKHMTRRVIKPQPTKEYKYQTWHDSNTYEWDMDHPLSRHKDFHQARCPYRADRLWVRETWRESGSNMGRDIPSVPCDVYYRADDGYSDGPWRPSIYMPRWASRITLTVKNVRVERLQDITPQEARAEGVCGRDMHIDSNAIYWFKRLWDSINKKRGYEWNVNPWVWVVEFEKLLPCSEGIKGEK